MISVYGFGFVVRYPTRMEAELYRSYSQPGRRYPVTTSGYASGIGSAFFFQQQQRLLQQRAIFEQQHPQWQRSPR